MQTGVQIQRMLGAGAGTQTVCRWRKVQLIVNRKLPGAWTCTCCHPVGWAHRGFLLKDSPARGHLPHHQHHKGCGCLHLSGPLMPSFHFPSFAAQFHFFNSNIIVTPSCQPQRAPWRIRGRLLGEEHVMQGELHHADV